MKRVAMLSAAVAVLMSVNLSAQGRNFAGTWVVDTEKTLASGGGMAGGRGGGGGGGAVMGRSGGDAGAVAVGGGGGGRAGGGAVMAAGGGGGGVGRSGGTTSGLAIALDANANAITIGAITYKLDGSVTNIENPNRKVTAKASWQGDKVAIETTSEGPEGPIVTRASWYLEGDSLVRENKSTGADGQEVVRKTFYKRS